MKNLPVFLTSQQVMEMWHVQAFQLLEFFSKGLQPYLPSGNPFDPPIEWNILSVLERRRAKESEIRGTFNDGLDVFMVDAEEAVREAEMVKARFPEENIYRILIEERAIRAIKRAFPAGYELNETLINSCPARLLLKMLAWDAGAAMSNPWVFFVKPDSEEELQKIINQIEKCCFRAKHIVEFLGEPPASGIAHDLGAAVPGSLVDPQVALTTQTKPDNDSPENLSPEIIVERPKVKEESVPGLVDDLRTPQELPLSDAKSIIPPDIERTLIAVEEEVFRLYDEARKDLDFAADGEWGTVHMEAFWREHSKEYRHIRPEYLQRHELYTAPDGKKRRTFCGKLLQRIVHNKHERQWDYQELYASALRIHNGPR